MKQTYVLITALFAGFVGGILGTQVALMREHPRGEHLVRARSFELLDETGKTISYWGIDKAGNAVLTFGSNRPVGGGPGPTVGLDDPHNQRASLGVIDDIPFLSFRARDGKKRMNLSLSEERPVFWMADENEKRVSLGFQAGDTPGPGSDAWALDFLPDRTRIGMFTIKEEGQTYLRGVLSVNQDKVKYSYQQLK